jgi:hypothetical protein
MATLQRSATRRREEYVPSFANLTDEQLRILTPEGYDTGRPTVAASMRTIDQHPLDHGSTAKDPLEIQPAPLHQGGRRHPIKVHGEKETHIRIHRAPGQPIGIRLAKPPAQNEYLVHFVARGSAGAGNVKVGEFVKSINEVELATLNDPLQIPRLFHAKGNVIDMVIARRLASDGLTALDSPRDRTFSPKALKELSANSKSK